MTTMIEMRPCTSVRISRDVCTLGLYEMWFRRTAYRAGDGHIEVHRGILRRHEMAVPADKIVGVKTKLSPLMGQSRVVIDTGFGAAAEAVFLTRKQARTFATACRAVKQDDREVR